MAAPSTTEYIPVSEIRDGIIALKDGSLRAVVKINAINFDLRSTEEQQAIIQQFQGFLNSIDFPLQIIVQSRRFDISKYLSEVSDTASTLANELLKVQADEYIHFVGELSELANIMSKSFFIVIPFSMQSHAQEKKGLLSNLKGVFKSSKNAAVEMTPEQTTAAKTQMMQRADLVLGSLSGMGLKGSVLNDQELQILLRDLYNPAVPETANKNTAGPAT